MKKFTLLFAISIICTVAFGQYVQKQVEMRKDVPTFAIRSSADYAELTKDAVWSNDFSVEADWTIASDAAGDGAEWVITTDATATAGWLPVYGMPDAFVSATADNGYALFQSDAQGDGSDAYTQDAWIETAAPIDLTSVATPRFVFSTYYKKWEDLIYFEHSINGGVDWTQIEIFTDVTQGGATTPDFTYLLNVPAIGGAANVLIRFRFVGDWDYGIFIDDISIVDAPDYDLKLMSAATNFFTAIDYHEAGQEQYYHYSSHYGMIPDEIIKSEGNAPLFFNAVVLNNGMLAATPSVDIVITDPETTEVYAFTYVHDVELAAAETDTLDIAWMIGEEFNMTADNFMLGEYDITYEVYVDGQVDGAPDNNSYATKFETTDFVYARDGGNLDGVCGPGIWLDGGNDGDMFGVDYTFFEETTIDSVQAYVTSTSNSGTALIAHIMQWDAGSEAWVAIAQSALVNIGDEDLGTWVNITFTDPAYIAFGGEETSKDIKVVLEFYYNGVDNKLWIGEDNTIPSSVWGTSWKFASDDGWTVITNYYNAAPMIRAFIVPTLLAVPTSFINGNVDMYPNPSTGIVTISNVEGATIEIINLMGQVVETIENAQEINRIDLSNNANGTYIIRVVNGNEISTSKFNLAK